jgi:hypothetical protein
MSSPGRHPSTELPAVDERLVAPESGFEIDDGKLSYVPPSDEEHGIGQGALAALLRAHRRDDLDVAVDMLTRTSRVDDFAPDASVFPKERDPRTGGRQLEELAFEVLATERLAHAAEKAERLVARGVRRVFALDVVLKRAFEWSPRLGTWSMLEVDARIEDPALAVSLPVAPLVDAGLADDATVMAYRARRHPEFLAERAEGRAEGRTEGRAEGRLLEKRDATRKLLASRFGPLAAEHEARLAAASLELLDRYFERALVATAVAEVFAP